MDADADHAKRKKEFLGYLGAKREEIDEQQEARRWYHGAQYEAKVIAEWNRRGQPVVTYNRIARKVNAIVGLLEKQRQEPRAYPRTPKQEAGAELATSVLRYVFDEQRWDAKSPECGLAGALNGIGGLEITIEPGDTSDPKDHDVGLEPVDPASFFYDARSLKSDFSDARFMGVGKWSDVEALVELFPDKEDDIRASLQSGSDLTSNPDSDKKWIDGGGDGTAAKRVRVIDHWYIERGEWRQVIYTGAVILFEGASPFKDEKGKTFCKYIMYSANVDHEGDRYGFHRNLRDPQREVNWRRAKGLHQLNSRRMMIEEGTGADIEKMRKESVRPDGVITYPRGSQPPQFDDAAKGAELQGQLGFLEEAKNEIENFGINPALIGQGVEQMSGVAARQQQQAGIAELGPYILTYRGWKLRVYRAVWCAVQEHWTAQRWIRVTDDERVAQIFAVNQSQDEAGRPMMDPQTLQPIVINALGSLDVDIIIDEGPDTINMAQDAYDTLTVMARAGLAIPPEVLIELSPIQGSVKQKVLQMLQQAKQQPPNPLLVAKTQADIAESTASAHLREAQAAKAASEAGQPPQGGDGQSASILDFGKAYADLAKTQAETEHTRAKTALDGANADKARADAHATTLGAIGDLLAPRQPAKTGTDL